jgi:hypothetical protein
MPASHRLVSLRIAEWPDSGSFGGLDRPFGQEIRQITLLMNLDVAVPEIVGIGLGTVSSFG